MTSKIQGALQNGVARSLPPCDPRLISAALTSGNINNDQTYNANSTGQGTDLQLSRLGHQISCINWTFELSCA